MTLARYQQRCASRGSLFCKFAAITRLSSRAIRNASVPYHFLSDSVFATAGTPEDHGAHPTADED
ncbi:hypothetical protein LXA20_17670, partial [Erwinia amylovora]|uniref:hypothetical protein n=1 Tax=Erwinia amylovora TaxID=552 RepID=UPI0020C0A49F